MLSSLKKQNTNLHASFLFFPCLVSMQFIFLSRKIALQIILSFYLILFKTLFHVYNFHLLTYHWFRSVSHKLGAGLPAGIYKVFLSLVVYECEAGHMNPFCLSSSWYICLPVIQPPGWTVHQHVGFLLAPEQDLLWISWDHQSCRATLGHHPPLSHTLLPSDFQLTSICQPTNCIRSKDTLPQTQNQFYHSFKKIICVISTGYPPLITQVDEN